MLETMIRHCDDLKGGIRQLQYKLVPGEAPWQLKLVKSTLINY